MKYEKKVWTQKELEDLVVLWQTSTSVGTVAAKLGRGNMAVSMKVSELRRNGVPLKRMTRQSSFDYGKLAAIVREM